MLTIIESGSRAWALAAADGDLHVYSREEAGEWSEVLLSEDSEQIDQDGSSILEALYEQYAATGRDGQTAAPEAEQEEPVDEEEQPEDEAEPEDEEGLEDEEEEPEDEAEPEDEEEPEEDDEEEPEDEAESEDEEEPEEDDEEEEEEEKPRRSRARTRAKKK